MSPSQTPYITLPPLFHFSPHSKNLSVKMTELPPEIITEILTYLPVKPLMRFKSVSKPWNALITSPKFIKRHFSQTLISNPNPENLIITPEYSIFTAVISQGNYRNDLRFTQRKNPLKDLPTKTHPSVGLIESCNGVLFLSEIITSNRDYETQVLFLYNPSTMSKRFIPKPPAPPCRGPFSDEFLGFGYDSLTDDYKVVKHIQWIGNGRGFSRKTHVYSLRNNSWKFVKDDTVPYFVQRTHGVGVNEMVYFLAMTQDKKPKLRCFDLRTDTFLILDCPKLESYDFSKMTMSVRGLRGCLCLLVNYQKKAGSAIADPLYNRRFLYADVWELRERGKESWVKLYRICKRELVDPCMYLRLVTYSKDKRSVLVEVDGERFVWYNLSTKRIENVMVKGLRGDSPYLASTFVESLVSVSDGKVMSKDGPMPSNDKVVPEGGSMPPRKNIKKADFLSSGFKLKL